MDGYPSCKEKFAPAKLAVQDDDAAVLESNWRGLLSGLDGRQDWIYRLRVRIWGLHCLQTWMDGWMD
jgi:hypothetical protein